MKPLVESLIGGHVMRVNKMTRACLTRKTEWTLGALSSNTNWVKKKKKKKK